MKSSPSQLPATAWQAARVALALARGRASAPPAMGQPPAAEPAHYRPEPERPGPGPGPQRPRVHGLFTPQGAHQMSNFTETGIRQVLEDLEPEQTRRIADWQLQAPTIRATRAMVDAVPEALASLGRDLLDASRLEELTSGRADPARIERAKIFFQVAERMRAKAPRSLEPTEPTKKEIEGAVAEWRAKVLGALEVPR
jgi:hypothetical protein